MSALKSWRFLKTPGLFPEALVGRNAWVRLWLNGPEIGNFGAQKTRSAAINDGYEIYQIALKIMAKSGLKNPRIRAIGVTCSSLSRGIYKINLYLVKKSAGRGLFMPWTALITASERG